MEQLVAVADPRPGASSGGCSSSVVVVGGPPASVPTPAATMIMDGLDTLPAQHHHLNHHHHHHVNHHAFLLTETAAAAAQHFNVLSFDTQLLYKGVSAGGSPVPGSAATASDLSEPAASEPQPGDLNTPVTTSGDIPSFFGPSTVVEPPPITGMSRLRLPRRHPHSSVTKLNLLKI